MQNMNKQRANTKLSLLAAALLLSTVAASVSACNTTRGAGQDVSSIGHDTSRAAAGTQNAIERSTTASPR